MLTEALSYGLPFLLFFSSHSHEILNLLLRLLLPMPPKFIAKENTLRRLLALIQIIPIFLYVGTFNGVIFSMIFVPTCIPSTFEGLGAKREFTLHCSVEKVNLSSCLAAPNFNLSFLFCSHSHSPQTTWTA